MMKQILIGSALAAIAVFIWGFVFWGSGAFDPFSHVGPVKETAIAASLKAGFDEPGVYSIPDQANGTDEEWIERHEAGPIAIVQVQPEGANPMAPTKLIGGLAHMFISIVIMAIALGMTNLAAYADRLKLVLLVSLAGTLYATLTDPIWFHATWGYFIWVTAYQMVSWLIAGAILAYFIKPKQT